MSGQYRGLQLPLRQRVHRQTLRDRHRRVPVQALHERSYLQSGTYLRGVYRIRCFSHWVWEAATVFQTYTNPDLTPVICIFPLFRKRRVPNGDIKRLRRNVCNGNVFQYRLLKILSFDAETWTTFSRRHGFAVYTYKSIMWTQFVALKVVWSYCKRPIKLTNNTGQQK